jgi:hypothetical protein
LPSLLLLLPLLLLPSLLLPPPLTMPKLMPVVLVVLVRGLALVVSPTVNSDCELRLVLVVSPLASRYATRASINSPDEGGNRNALSMPSALIALSMQSACPQHALSMHSACNQHAISMHPRRHRLTIALGHAINMPLACTQHAISMHPRWHRLTIALGEHRLAKEISAARPSRISATEIYLSAVLGARSLRSGGSNGEKLRSHAMHVAHEVVAWNDAQRRSERMWSSVAISGYQWPSPGTPSSVAESLAIRGNHRQSEAIIWQ